MASQPAFSRKQILLLAIVLLPSLAVLIYGLDMPHLGFLRDDGIYLASAESLARGEGYRIASRPGTPWNVKYPPLYSALLSPVFLIGKPLQAGLAVASVLNWLALLIFAALCLVFFQWHGFPAPLLLTFFCLSFTGTVNCAHSLLSDLWMACAVLAALLVRERSEAGAAVLTAAAVLIRTASLALLAALIADSVRQRRFRQAALAGVVAGLPALLWMAWSSAHKGPIADINDYYMSTYFYYLSHEIPPGRLLEHAAPADPRRHPDGTHFSSRHALAESAKVGAWPGGNRRSRLREISAPRPPVVCRAVALSDAGVAVRPGSAVLCSPDSLFCRRGRIGRGPAGAPVEDLRADRAARRSRGAHVLGRGVPAGLPDAPFPGDECTNGAGC